MAQSDSVQASDTQGPDFVGLSLSSRASLTLLTEVCKGFHPEPGALHDMPQITVAARDIAEVCRLAKEDPRLAARQLICLACVDYKEHFQLFYRLRSIEPELTIALKVSVPYDDPRLPSVTPVWRAADWYEREAHDLFGVTFEGHPDLAPLLLYEGFEGYPGRKDFPFYEYQEF